MSDFGNILRRGRRMFDMKNEGGIWGRCEECDERALLFSYIDDEKETWKLCEICATDFVKEEE